MHVETFICMLETKIDDKSLKKNLKITKGTETE